MTAVAAISPGLVIPAGESRYQGESAGISVFRSTGAWSLLCHSSARWLKLESIEKPTICPLSLTFQPFATASKVCSVIDA